jgi:hypothetical protein
MTFEKNNHRNDPNIECAVGPDTINDLSWILDVAINVWCKITPAVSNSKQSFHYVL